jgi:hypothetical protein
MFATYRIDPARGEVRMTYRSHPTYAEWTVFMDLIFADPLFVPGMHFLLDKRAAGSIPDNAHVEALASYYEVHHAKFGRSAVVVTGPHAFGMSRMVEGYIVDDRVRTFYEMEEAERWLIEGV